MSQRTPQASPPTDEELAAFQRLTLGLVGMALRSLDAVRGAVSLPQLRLLLVVSEAGRPPSSHVADALAISRSAVTHAADKLHAAGYLRRVDDPANRRIVALELTASGRALVDSVLAWRRAELTRVVGQLGAGERRAILGGVTRFAEALAGPADQQAQPADHPAQHADQPEHRADQQGQHSR